MSESHRRVVLRGLRWPGDIEIADGRITAIGDVTIQAGDRIVSCANMIATAGLVNTHHHLFQWVSRGRGVNSPLRDWLAGLYPLWQQLRPEDVHTAATVGLAELALSGCTAVADHQYLIPRADPEVFDAIIDSAEAVGLRLCLAIGGVDRDITQGGRVPAALAQGTDAVLTAMQRVLDRPRDPQRLRFAIAPPNVLTVSRELMRSAAELATGDIGLHTHLAETASERELCVELHQRTPVELLAEAGWMRDDAWFAHAIHLNDNEIGMLADAGAGVSHCPSSNGRLGDGICRVTDLLGRGIPVSLGVDGVASNESGRLFPEIRLALLLARLRAEDPTALTTGAALAMATANGARSIGWPELGRLQVGAPADIAVWPGADLEDMPEPVDALILGPDRTVEHLLVAGRFVVEGGALNTVDLPAQRRALLGISRRLG